MKYFCLICLFLSSIAYAHSPHPLKFLNGRKVHNLEDWELRKQEIKNIIQDEVYGYLPKNISSQFQIIKNFNISKEILYKEVRISFEKIPKDRYITLSIFSPRKMKRSPVFLTLNPCGNHTVHSSLEITITKNKIHHPVKCKKTKRGSLSKSYPIEMIISSGYSLATFDVSDMDADYSPAKSDGIQGVIQSSKDPNKNWGTLISWAWGLMRSMDYLSVDKSLEQIILTGHSRRGKAALLAGAFDQRADMVIPHQSGLGGTAPFRNANFRESASLIMNNSFIYKLIGEPTPLTHWFSSSFKEKSKNVQKLNFDSDHLIALVAPRPFMDVQGNFDFWAGPNSTFDMLKRAHHVYQFLGSQGLKGIGKTGHIKTVKLIKIRRKLKRIIRSKYLAMNSNNTGNLGQYRANTMHVLNEYYWKKFINFANLHL